jgi:hypothetical protein
MQHQPTASDRASNRVVPARRPLPRLACSGSAVLWRSRSDSQEPAFRRASCPGAEALGSTFFSCVGIAFFLSAGVTLWPLRLAAWISEVLA